MIIDAHHHCWDPTRRAYPWLIDPAFGPINRPYALDDFRAALNDQVPGALSTCHPPWLRIGLVPAPTAIRTILVQAMNDPAETVDLCAVAAGSNGLVAGVIGWADLSSPRLADQIADLRAGVGGALLVGLRHPVS
ncbi:MAG: hypothetical protein JXA67_14210, partial [Micromonosporaceae bacterium]|nr:hypothetical protein [Micromonosporaceae bacterium]